MCKVPAVSGSGNCYDDAIWNHSLGWVQERIPVEAVGGAEYVEVFCNRIRRLSALGYRNPQQYVGLLSVT